MEARWSGFGGASMPPPAYRFDPTDADIVAHYLLPRAAGGAVPNPRARAVIVDADPCSCPPWELLRRRGRAGGGSDRAFFFFGPVVPERTKAGRRVSTRAVSEGEEGGGGGGGGGVDEIELRYKKISLSYRSKEEDARMAAAGWVMDEYEIADPPAPLHAAAAVLSRVRITGARGKKMFQKHQAAAAKKLAPGPEEPGPSNYLDDDDDDPVVLNRVVVMDQGEGASGGGAQAEAVRQGDDSGGFLAKMAGYYSVLPGAGEDGGYSGDNSNSYCSEGITFDYCFNEGDGNGD